MSTAELITSNTLNSAGANLSADGELVVWQTNGDTEMCARVDLDPHQLRMLAAMATEAARRMEEA